MELTRPYSVILSPQPKLPWGFLRQRPVSFVLSCEHGGNLLPTPYEHLFEGSREILSTHRGYDPGALPLAKALAEHWNAPLVYSEVTRLLAELNRSTHHPRWLSEWSRQLTAPERQVLREWLFEPYRKELRAMLDQRFELGHSVVHLSVHSFTPIWNGEPRRVDLALLYDPRRAGERELCGHWTRALRKRIPHWNVRRNFPYLGAADGLTTSLRRRYDPGAYWGLELEVRNDHLPHEVPALVENLEQTCRQAFEAWSASCG